MSGRILVSLASREGSVTSMDEETPCRLESGLLVLAKDLSVGQTAEYHGQGWSKFTRLESNVYSVTFPVTATSMSHAKELAREQFERGWALEAMGDVVIQLGSPVKP